MNERNGSGGPDRPPRRRRGPGLVIVHTGDGKGKTTAALGLAVRAAGQGLRVLILQFLKGDWKYGELDALPRIGVEIRQMGLGFTWLKHHTPDEHRAAIRAAWETVLAEARSGRWDMLILDEINYVLGLGERPDDGGRVPIEDILPLSEVVEFLRNKPPALHLVLTGRGAKPEIVEVADLVTEMRMIKHPYQQGRRATRGIEF